MVVWAKREILEWKIGVVGDDNGWMLSSKAGGVDMHVAVENGSRCDGGGKSTKLREMEPVLRS